MQKHIFATCLVTAFTLQMQAADLPVTGADHFEAPARHTLWYDQPAPTDYAGWQEYSLPIGNGDLGGSVFGGVKEDKFTFNEKSLWYGFSDTRPNPQHGDYLKFGTLWTEDLSGNLDAGVTDYVRWLDIDHGTAGVSFTDATGTRYTRTYIASQTDQVISIRYTAEGPNTLHLRFRLDPGAPLTALSDVKPEVRRTRGGLDRMQSAAFEGHVGLLAYSAHLAIQTDDHGAVRRQPLRREGTDLTVRGVREVTLYLSAMTDYDGSNPVTFTNGQAIHLTAMTADACTAAARKTWQQLYDDHVASFGNYMGRVNLNLGGNSPRNTKDLIEFYALNQKNRDSREGLFLEELYYHYGRYLCVASNGKKAVPNNLQGLWTDTDNGHAPWNSDIHTNINIQMNYWPCEQNNLSDLHLPLLDYICNIAQSPGCLGQAKKAGQSVGWVVNTESNLFGGMSAWSDNYTIANAWYCTHLWQHYRYTLDKEYLARVFPTMWSAAQYWAERLILASDGTYECPDEFSPEQGPQRENATAHSQQLVRELFENTLDALVILEKCNEIPIDDILDVREKLAKLDLGLHTEEYKSGNGWNTLIPDGTKILREWKYSPYTAGQNAHRHTSHLMALYPFSQIVPGDEYFEPAVASLTQRTDASTGWAMGWRVNLWARALDGNHARRMLGNALLHAGHEMNYSSGGIYYNLWDSHTPFQIDGNFGVCAGISEMLLQSKYRPTPCPSLRGREEVTTDNSKFSTDGVSTPLPSGEGQGVGLLRLLPALPDGWKEGNVSGLKAEGNFTVDETWSKGVLTKAVITSHAGQPLRIVYGYNAKTRAYAFDQTVETRPGEVLILTFKGTKGTITRR